MHEIKYAKQTAIELMEHVSSTGDSHNLQVDFGNGAYGLWCKDCQEPIGIYASKKLVL